MGYTAMVTYTQDGETGASLRAAGWLVVAVRKPRPDWAESGARFRVPGVGDVERTLWAAPWSKFDTEPLQLPWPEPEDPEAAQMELFERLDRAWL